MLKSPVKEREGGYLNLNLGVFAKQQQRFLSSTSINRKYILKSIVFPDYPSVLLMRATITGFFNPSRFCHPERSEASRFHCLVFLVLRDPSLRFYPSLKGLRQFPVLRGDSLRIGSQEPQSELILTLTVEPGICPSSGTLSGLRTSKDSVLLDSDQTFLLSANRPRSRRSASA